ncbi:transcription repressor NadR [uncultured Clostridium sp.]|uniref:transcription repressor NadR n=1 Tax=uncultured Clostridium sp. TaxID=59620 RepID=UPI0028EA51F1|nr:transcription repressor NadR [uncultured Clostridium sp.]
MNSEERRQYIINLLVKSSSPIKGQKLAEELGLTRQVIVKDIAILRAKGTDIIATPDGYIINKDEKGGYFKILALCHNSDEIEEELKTIIKYGGVVKDVLVDHPLYGEIKAMLMIKNLYDVDNFVKKFTNYKAEPLLILTNGVHLHTIWTEKEDQMNKIIEELSEKGYLLEG